MERALARQVELSERGPRISLRVLAGYIDERINPDNLLDDDALSETIMPYQFIIIDRAEKLRPETLTWLVTRSDSFSGAVLLVVRRRWTFEQIALEAGMLVRAIQIDLQDFVGPAAEETE